MYIDECIVVVKMHMFSRNFYIPKIDICLCVFRSSPVDDDMDDEYVKQLVIITQTPPPAHNKKHPTGDRAGTHGTRSKLSVNISQAINDGLYFYEQVC